MAENRQPVTFLMPVRNGAKFLDRSISSIQKMSSEKDEIIVVDDSSSDNSLAILTKLKTRYPNLTVISNSKPGLVNALNLGIRASQNALIARVDVDDLYAVDRITKQTSAFSQGTVAMFSDYVFYSEHKSNLGKIVTSVIPSAVSCSLITSQRTAHPSVVFLKDAVLEVGSYRKQDFPAEDLSLWLRLSRIGDLRSIPEPLLTYSINPVGVSSTKRYEMLQAKQRLLTEIAVNPSDTKKILEEGIEIANYYEDLNESAQRKLLLARDLLIIAQTHAFPQSYRNLAKKIVGRNLLRPELLKASAVLLLEKYNRSQLR
jgi:glycosyltransferase involved in cell wall biosynthesis